MQQPALTDNRPLMTDVHFYFNVPDKLSFACRLARKALMQARPILLTAPDPTLQTLDDMLWHMNASDFVAHNWLPAPANAQPPQAPSPIWLCANMEAEPPEHPNTLLTLWDEVQPAFSRFEHVYELVLSHDEADRQRARARWRYYQQRGYALHGHDLEATPHG